MTFEEAKVVLQHLAEERVGRAVREANAREEAAIARAMSKVESMSGQ